MCVIETLNDFLRDPFGLSNLYILYG